MAGPSADDDDDDDEEYIPGSTGKADAVMLASTAPVQRVIVDLGQLHLNLRDAEVKAQAEKVKEKARADAIDDEEAEFSDSSAEVCDARFPPSMRHTLILNLNLIALQPA